MLKKAKDKRGRGGAAEYEVDMNLRKLQKKNQVGLRKYHYEQS